MLRPNWFAAVAIVAMGWPGSTIAAQDRQAQITAATGTVELVGRDGVTATGSLGENILEGTAVRTGVDARTELTFANETVARLGANTVFNFKDGTRHLEFHDGIVLLQVPKNAKSAMVRTEKMAAILAGSTAIFECHPTVYKFLVLEGIGRLYRPDHLGDSVLVRAGQMIIGNPNSPVSEPVDFDVARLLRTSKFITDFAPLRSERLMAGASQKQERAKSKKRLIDTNLVIFGGGTVVSLTNPKQTEQANHEILASIAPPTGTIPASSDLGTIESGAPVSNPTSAGTSPEGAQ